MTAPGRAVAVGGTVVAVGTGVSVKPAAAGSGVNVGARVGVSVAGKVGGGSAARLTAVGTITGCSTTSPRSRP